MDLFWGVVGFVVDHWPWLLFGGWLVVMALFTWWSWREDRAKEREWEERLDQDDAEFNRTQFERFGGVADEGVWVTWEMALAQMREWSARGRAAEEERRREQRVRAANARVRRLRRKVVSERKRVA